MVNSCGLDSEHFSDQAALPSTVSPFRNLISPRQRGRLGKDKIIPIIVNYVVLQSLKELGLPEPGSTVAVAMSGGVDSSLVALLMAERDCRVVG